MSSTSGIGASPAPTTPPASQTTSPSDKSPNAEAAAAKAPDNSKAQSTDAVQPSKPPGQGQVVYISA